MKTRKITHTNTYPNFLNKKPERSFSFKTIFRAIFKTGALDNIPYDTI